jgi:hypothetical protein
LTTPKPINISETIKNGKREGNTISHHIFRPRIEASTDSWGKAIIETAIIVTEHARRMVFNFERYTD